MSADAYDVVVIGGGTGGLVVASGCARLGRRVALIERDELGGDCLWSGCVPTKALVASARLAQAMRGAAAFGIAAQEPAIAPAAVMQAMKDARAAVAPHDDPARFRALGIDVIKGAARFVARGEVEVDGRRLRGRDVVIATGSRTAVPPIDGLAEAGFLDHASLVRGDSFPASVAILGGGPIGIEFAQCLRRLGSRVVVVEMLDTILPQEDHEVAARVHATLAAEGVEIRCGNAASSVRVENGRKIVRLAGRDIAVEEVFVASGRRGNIEELGLEGIGVRTDRSFVAVDRFLQTSEPRIWACGDVHGGLQFTHVAAYEGVKLVRNMLFPGRSAVDYANVPWCIYTDPEVARVGLTEREAIEKAGRVHVYRAEVADVDRAIVDRARAGMVKLVCDGRGRILGAHIVAHNASALIGEIVAARAARLDIRALARLVSPYPSMAEAIRKAAAAHYQELGSSWIGRGARLLARISQ